MQERCTAIPQLDDGGSSSTYHWHIPDASSSTFLPPALALAALAFCEGWLCQGIAGGAFSGWERRSQYNKPCHVAWLVMHLARVTDCYLSASAGQVVENLRTLLHQAASVEQCDYHDSPHIEADTHDNTVASTSGRLASCTLFFQRFEPPPRFLVAQLSQASRGASCQQHTGQHPMSSDPAGTLSQGILR